MHVHTVHCTLYILYIVYCVLYTVHTVHCILYTAGLAESISFNVSSVVPPSPIPPNTNPDCYTARRSARQRGLKPGAGKTTDILMLPPDKE